MISQRMVPEPIMMWHPYVRQTLPQHQIKAHQHHQASNGLKTGHPIGTKDLEY